MLFCLRVAMETTIETMTKMTDSTLRAMLQKSWGVGLHTFDHISFILPFENGSGSVSKNSDEL